MEYRQQLEVSWKRRHTGLGERLSVRRGVGVGGAGESALRSRVTPQQHFRQALFEQLLRDVEVQGLSGLGNTEMSRPRVRRVLDQALRTRPELRLTERERLVLENELVWEVSGLGPLEPLLADPTVSDVLVNGPSEVWVDRHGRLELTDVRFDDAAHVIRLLGRIVNAHGRHLDEASPSVDIRLADGSRVHAVLPPLCMGGPVVAIRRARSHPLRMEDLCAYGTISPQLGEFLTACVASGLNIVVSGGAATGKTTLMNVLSGFIPKHERVVTVEETAELQFAHPHVVSLEGRLANIEGRGEVSLRDLVRNALRLRADRLIVGEVRGAEVFDMLQAMNTGHNGSMTTVHANSPEDALRRLENLVLMAGMDLPSRATRELLGAVIDVVVQIARFRDGSRHVTSVCEVAHVGDAVKAREIFRYDAETTGSGDASAVFAESGECPSFVKRLAAAGFVFDGIIGKKSETEKKPSKQKSLPLESTMAEPAPSTDARSKAPRSNGTGG